MSDLAPDPIGQSDPDSKEGVERALRVETFLERHAHQDGSLRVFGGAAAVMFGVAVLTLALELVGVLNGPLYRLGSLVTALMAGFAGGVVFAFRRIARDLRLFFEQR